MPTHTPSGYASTLGRIAAWTVATVGTTISFG